MLSVFAETLKSIADGRSPESAITPTGARRLRRRTSASSLPVRARDGAAAAEAMLVHLDEAGRYSARKYSDLVSRPVHWLQ